MAERYQMYRFCTTFNCSPEEYERRPYKESQWLTQIDAVHNEAVNEAQEKAAGQSS